VALFEFFDISNVDGDGDKMVEDSCSMGVTEVTQVVAGGEGGMVLVELFVMGGNELDDFSVNELLSFEFTSNCMGTGGSETTTGGGGFSESMLTEEFKGGVLDKLESGGALTVGELFETVFETDDGLFETRL
jgi:hypothetical protein